MQGLDTCRAVHACLQSLALRSRLEFLKLLVTCDIASRKGEADLLSYVMDEYGRDRRAEGYFERMVEEEFPLLTRIHAIVNNGDTVSSLFEWSSGHGGRA